MIIQAQNKNSAVNQLEYLLVTWNGFQRMAHVRPSVTVFWCESGDRKVGGRGGVVDNILQILINSRCWDNITWKVNKTENCVLKLRVELEGIGSPETYLVRREAHSKGLVMWNRTRNHSEQMLHLRTNKKIAMGTFFTTRLSCSKGWARFLTVLFQISPKVYRCFHLSVVI